VALTPGTRFGPYEVVSALGTGGMGEVYRAHDTRLKRDVAIKVLLAAVAQDPERLARFEREAQILASLNHPNIAAIHGVEQAGGTTALILEFIDGPTLADRIAAGPIPIDEALAIARQITDGLEAAHDRGVIHRDLKPANVKLRPDGTVKVLDFGLAKAMEPGAGSGIPGAADLSLSPTLSSPAMTRAGIVLGTAPYMSPEQARGTAVDRRADVWAFGCVLYELLTRRRAFMGETVTDVMAAIIEREPDWHVLPAATPAGVRRLLRRCLAKEPKRRLHDIADARIELDDVRGGTAPEESGAVPSQAPRGRLPRGLGFAATAIGAAAIAWFVAQAVRPAASDGSALDGKLEPLTYDSGATRMPALSADGRLLAYASDRSGNGDLDIWVQQMSGGTALRLTDDPADDTTPDFSPDGSQIAFRSERNGGGVYAVSALGGPARLVAPDGRRPRFSPDGSRIAYWSGNFRGAVTNDGAGTFVVALTGGIPTRILPDFESVNEPVWAPDGSALLVAARRERSRQDAESFDWWLVPLDGRPPVNTGVFQTPLLRGGMAAPARWTTSGVLFSFGQDLWRVTLSGAGRLSGPPRRLTLGVGPYVDPVSGPNGEIVFARPAGQRLVERASLTNPTEPETRLYADTETITVRASGTSDGSIIVVERSAGSAREIWTRNTQSGRQALVVRVPTRDQLNATVSPDGARIAYTQASQRVSGSAGTGFVIETAGGVPRKVCDTCALHGFLADNQRVLAEFEDGHAISVIDVRTAAARDVVVASDGSRLDRPHASPDDRWIAFRRARSAGTGGKTIVVRLASDGPVVADGLTPIDEPTTTGRPAGWSLDSRVVYLALDSDGFRCIWGQRIDPASGALVGKPFVARHFHKTIGMSTSFGNAVTASGFLYEAADYTSNLWKLVPQSSAP
jgi:Tol biopolymer transport system component